MEVVDIEALESRIREYLRLVRAGEIVLVTDRDEVVAEIARPRTPLPGRVSRWEAFISEEESQGRLTRAKRTESLALEELDRDPLGPAPNDLLAMLRASRDDPASQVRRK